MSKQIEDIKEIKLLDSQVHLCEEIRKLLRKKEKEIYLLHRNIQNMISCTLL